MKLLALEFSSSQRSVAVIQCPGAPGSTSQIQSRSINASKLSVSEVIETAPNVTKATVGSAAHPLSMIEEVLRTAALEREQIDCLAIGIGPGSYSGIRSAIALAQGWQLARPQVRLLAVSSVQCLAAHAHAEGIHGKVHVVVDAQRNEFYLAGFEITPEAWKETHPLKLASLLEVQACESNGAILLGPEITKWLPAARQMFPRAATLAQLASNQSDFVPAERLEPIYLRETNFVKAPPPRILAAP